MSEIKPTLVVLFKVNKTLTCAAKVMKRNVKTSVFCFYLYSINEKINHINSTI